VTALAALDERGRDLVWTAWTAIETARHPVPARDYPALADPTLRHHLERLATQAGRTLVEGPRNYWLTGYDDTVADRLAAEGLGVLPPDDRAVLALVLINTVCLHRARTGTTASGWDAPGVRSEDLLGYRPQYQTVIRAALRRLEARDLISRSPTSGIIPGPALRRLTPAQSQRLWEDLIVAADPHGPLASAIRARRAGAAA
jgi:hypothetical protein